MVGVDLLEFLLELVVDYRKVPIGFRKQAEKSVDCFVTLHSSLTEDSL